MVEYSRHDGCCRGVPNARGSTHVSRSSVPPSEQKRSFEREGQYAKRVLRITD